MFPSFNHSGVIPPFWTDPTQNDGSPYITDLCTLVSGLGTTPERRQLLTGLLDYRAAMRGVGITSGFQLIDGSFTENCEILRGRAPSDIDLLTYAHLPVGPADVFKFVQSNSGLFISALTKQTYGCDAYFVDMGKATELIIDETFYWHGLFSHQKITATWKGMLRIPLMADDIAARVLLASISGGSNGP